MTSGIAGSAYFAVSQQVLTDIVLAHHTSNGDGAHDLHHLQRVWRNCERIGAGCEPAPQWHVLSAAAFLHDLINVPKSSPDRARASTLSADAAVAALAQRGFPSAKLDAVWHAIQTHSFSADITPKSLEARVLQDADRLDALGALGLARTFYVAGQLGSRLLDGDDPLAQRRMLDDRAFALDHFQTKLYGLVETMNTPAAKALATTRVTYMRDFVAQLQSEI
jgi:uncharacterized protein